MTTITFIFLLYTFCVVVVDEELFYPTPPKQSSLMLYNPILKMQNGAMSHFSLHLSKSIQQSELYSIDPIYTWY